MLKYREKHWVTREGKRIRIKDMSYKHLINVMKYSRRNKIIIKGVKNVKKEIKLRVITITLLVMVVLVVVFNIVGNIKFNIW